ncbi:MAG: hypothetical protein GXO07_05960 [Crenarchaeota archaeon]|nr:hypothetical protein [Thermoproteota archaeon]
MKCVSKICYLEDVEVPSIDKPENEESTLIVLNEEPVKAEYVAVFHQPLCKNSVFPFGNFVRAVEKAAKEMEKRKTFVVSEEGCGRASAVAIAAALARKVDYKRIKAKFGECKMNYELLVNAIFVGLVLKKFGIELGVEKLMSGCEGIKGWRNTRELCELREEAHRLAREWELS